jgi:hypothetical protein
MGVALFIKRRVILCLNIFQKRLFVLFAKTNKDEKCILVAIVGTSENGIVNSIPVHVDCLDLWCTEDLIFMKIKKE